MIEYLKSLLSDDYMPHGHCYLWKPEILWLHAISDGITFLSYMAIPIFLVYIVYKSKYKVPYPSLFILFSVFILACGATHLMAIVNIWKSEYLVSGIIKALTAMASLLTAIASIPVLKKIVKIVETEEFNDKEIK